ncbi:MAG: choice-of-anchor D domain-containing protein [Myxococcaceae bacterium]
MTRVLLGLGLSVALLGCEPQTMLMPADAGPPPPPVRKPDCLALPADIDFGEVPRGSQAAVQFFLANHSAQSIIVELGPVSAPFAATEEGKVEVRAGQSLPLRFSFQPPDARLQFIDVSYSPGLGCTAQTLRLHGLGLGGLEVPPAVEFDALPLGQTSTRTVTVRNTRRTDVDVELVAGSLSPPVSATVTAFTVPALGTFDLPLEISPTELGTAVVTLELRVPMTGENVMTTVLASSGLPAIEVDRTVIDVPRLPLVTPMSLTRISRAVLLSNTGVSDLRIERVEVIAGPGSSATEVQTSFVGGERVLPTGVAPFNILFEPHAPLGPRAWTVRITTNDAAHPTTDISVTGTVVDQATCSLEIVPSPTLLTLSGSSLPRSGTVTLTNPNPDTCLVDGFTLNSCSTAFTVQPADEQFTIDSHASRVITVTTSTSGSCFLSWQTWGAFGSSVQVRSL